MWLSWIRPPCGNSDAKVSHGNVVSNRHSDLMDDSPFTSLCSALLQEEQALTKMMMGKPYAPYYHFAWKAWTEEKNEVLFEWCYAHCDKSDQFYLDLVFKRYDQVQASLTENDVEPDRQRQRGKLYETLLEVAGFGDQRLLSLAVTHLSKAVDKTIDAELKADHLFVYRAAERGHLDMVNALLANGFVMGPCMFAAAACSGQIPLLEWCVERGCAINVTPPKPGYSGYCPESVDACGLAAILGHVDVLKWLIAKGFRYDTHRLSVWAIDYAQLQVLTFLRQELKWEWTTKTWEAATLFEKCGTNGLGKRRAIARKWLIANGFPKELMQRQQPRGPTFSTLS